MAIVMNPIYTQTVGAGGAATVTFNNIPQFYTDLQVVISGRFAPATVQTGYYIYFNNNGANYSDTFLQATGSTSGSSREVNNVAAFCGQLPGSSATANTFGNAVIWVPNYAGANFKSWLVDSVAENNATQAFSNLTAGLWRNTSAITSLSLTSYGNGDWVQHSTFSLYGIIRPGA